VTGKGTYKLIKIKNRSQDPHERKVKEREEKKSDGYQIKSGINMNQTTNKSLNNYIG
jgi:hypothetical protein